MAIYQRKLIFIFFLFISNTNEKEIDDEENGKLLFVWEHFRHGARGPYANFDPVTWVDFLGVKWESIGELNPSGLRAHYLLGIATRKKYKNFLSEKYNPNEIIIISSDVNRTIASAMSNLQGIYNNYTTPNLTYSQINRSIINSYNKTYQSKIDKKKEEIKESYIQNGISIIPIHSFPKYPLKELSNQFYQYTHDTYGEYIFKFMNISWKDNKDYIWKDPNLLYICDTYIADYYAGREMENIKKTGIDMDAFYNHCLNSTIVDTYVAYGIPPTKASYITVSPLFRTIFDYMDKRIYLNEHNNSDSINSSYPKYIIYSGHDSTVAAIDVFLEYEFNITFDIPEYTTSQYFELWEINKTYYIKYLVNQKEKAKYEFSRFKKAIFEKIIPKDELEDICFGRNDTAKENLFKILFFSSISLATVCLLLLISLLILEARRKKLE